MCERGERFRSCQSGCPRHDLRRGQQPRETGGAQGLAKRTFPRFPEGDAVVRVTYVARRSGSPGEDGNVCGNTSAAVVHPGRMDRRRHRHHDDRTCGQETEETRQHAQELGCAPTIVHVSASRIGHDRLSTAKERKPAGARAPGRGGARHLSRINRRGGYSARRTGYAAGSGDRARVTSSQCNRGQRRHASGSLRVARYLPGARGSGPSR